MGRLEVVEKKNGRTPPLERIREADHSMRTKWIEKMRQDGCTMTEAARLCKTEFAYLFRDLHSEKPQRPPRAAPPSNAKPRAKAPRTEPPRVEADKAGKI